MKKKFTYYVLVPIAYAVGYSVGLVEEFTQGFLKTAFHK